MSAAARARKLTDEILALTEGLRLTGEAAKAEDEVAAYVALIDGREPLVQELMKLDIDDAARRSRDFARARNNIARITELDKANLEVAHDMYDTLKDAIRLVKQGQRLNKGYFASQDIVSTGFDVRQ